MLANNILTPLIRKHERVYASIALACGIPNFIFILNMSGINQVIIPLYIVVPSFIYFTIIVFYCMNRIMNDDNDKDAQRLRS